jgi:hypothetical protein
MLHYLPKYWTRSAISVGPPAERVEDHRRIPAGANGYDDLEYDVGSRKRMVYFARPTAWAGTLGMSCFGNGLCLVTDKERRNRSLSLFVIQARAAPNVLRFLCEPGGPAMAACRIPQAFLCFCGRLGVEQQE